MTKPSIPQNIHELKTWPPYFQEILDGFKNFDVRKDDREFKVGDALILREYDDENGYSGRVTHRSIIYKLTGGRFGIRDGFCVLGLNVLVSTESK